MAEEDEAESTAHRHAAMIQPRRPPLADRPASRYSGVVTTEPVEWNRIAVEVANDVRKHLGEEPIGVYQPSEDDLRLAVLFGNGETSFDENPTAQIAVELLRQRFDGLGVIEIGFGLDSKARSTWAMVVKAPGRVIDEHHLERYRQELKEVYRSPAGRSSSRFIRTSRSRLIRLAAWEPRTQISDSSHQT